ncbi:ribose-5-phosphate isomerase [uncultured Sunxiuqinia sp.]|uniref:ribose-5-phosphate isomerase n=1 Tax=uncultured Sunxiuqinia sp. TaxID=1573825 RepID=UPI002AA8C3C8|nr:ribose-5-phosphate isomerase [uncultured Sunxiuqinia sp.]
MKTIALGTDHAGFLLKEAVKKHLSNKGFRVVDLGTDSEEAVDYADFVIPAAETVAKNKADLGIVFGGSGNGEAIAANKVKGVRCALCWSVQSATLAKQHNNANVIALGGRMVSEELALEIVDRWLVETFEGGRHLRRIQKLHDYESGEK